MSVMLGAIVFSAILAQAATPAPDAMMSASPAPGGTPASMPSSSGTPSDDYVRRGPGTSPRMLGPHATTGDVTIANSGSTNTAGYTIVVHPDLSTDVTVGGTTERKTVGAPQARWLVMKLRAAAPLADMSGGRCMKSASFGSATTIAYAGQTTPDLSCPGDATTRELMRTANVIVEQLHVPLRRMRGQLR